MGVAVPPLPQYAFMAWFSVRGSTGTTLPFTLLIRGESLNQLSDSQFLK